MGFSVSGSAAVIFLGIFIAFGTLFVVVSDGHSVIVDAHQDQNERELAQANTEITVDIVEDAPTTAVEITNTGSTTLSISETTIMIDGIVEPSPTIVEPEDTDLLVPGETLVLEVTTMEDNIIVITEHGVTERAEVN